MTRTFIPKAPPFPNPERSESRLESVSLINGEWSKLIQQAQRSGLVAPYALALAGLGGGVDGFADVLQVGGVDAEFLIFDLLHGVEDIDLAVHIADIDEPFEGVDEVVRCHPLACGQESISIDLRAHEAEALDYRCLGTVQIDRGLAHEPGRKRKAGHAGMRRFLDKKASVLR